MEKVIVQDSAGSVACTYLISKVTPKKRTALVKKFAVCCAVFEEISLYPKPHKCSNEQGFLNLVVVFSNLKVIIRFRHIPLRLD